MIKKHQAVQTEIYDVVIIGGGINGAGIARDAAGRGLRVLLCEKGDLGGATSSASTKLIHGGLRYLEYGEFRLVQEALYERETLLNIAPHIIWPMQFILPHQRHMRPAWMIRAGLFLYDHLAKRKKLSGSKGINLRKHVIQGTLKDVYKKGFIYSDCWVQDARLVVLNAMDAKDRGATILPRTECLSARQHKGVWDVELYDHTSQTKQKVQAKVLVNAAGPWVNKLLGKVIESKTRYQMRLVKGSHIVVPKLFDHPQAYILQQSDKRIVFAIPYENDFTLIGTTEEECTSADKPQISEVEITYLCDAVNQYFSKAIMPNDVVWSYAGVRPLLDAGEQEASKVSRDYQLDVETNFGAAPVLHVLGGKITTYRVLAENVMQKLAPFLDIRKGNWTADAHLPGGDFTSFDMLLKEMERKYPWLPKQLIWRYVRNYGTLTDKLIDTAKNLGDLGHDLGGGLYEAELEYLMEYEWARYTDDVLWRRSKMGLHVPKGTESKLLVWMSGKVKKYKAS